MRSADPRTLGACARRGQFPADATGDTSEEDWRRQADTRSLAAVVVVTAALLALLERLLSQGVARTNAAQASVRLIHDRRQLDHVEAFLSQHLRDQSNGQPTSAEAPADSGMGGR